MYNTVIKGASFIYMATGLILGIILGYFKGDTPSKMVVCLLPSFAFDEIVFRKQLKEDYLKRTNS